MARNKVYNQLSLFVVMVLLIWYVWRLMLASVSVMTVRLNRVDALGGKMEIRSEMFIALDEL